MRPRRMVWAAGVGLAAAAIAIPGSTIAGVLDVSPAATPKLLASLWLFKLVAATLGLILAAAALFATRCPAASLWRPPEATAEVVPRRIERALLLSIFAAALVLRVWGLGSDLWIDEVFTLTDSVRLPVGRLLTWFPDDNEHLLYSLLGHASVSLFGENAIALRLPALLFGLASLWAVLRLGRLLLNRAEALLATALLALSYHHIWFSQNARGYTGLLLATVLATELLLRGLWRGRWSTWASYAAVVAFGMWIHLTMVFVALAHGAVLLALLARAGTLRQGRWRGPAALGLAGLFTLQIYALILPQVIAFFLRPGAGSSMSVRKFKSTLWLVSEAVRGLRSGLVFGGIGLLGAAALLVVGLYWFARRDRVAAALFLLPAFVGGASLVVLHRNLWPRFFFNEVGFAALLAAHGAVVAAGIVARRMPRAARISPRRIRLIFAALLIAASGSSLPGLYRYPKQDFTGARDFVVQQCGPLDRVVAAGLAAEAYQSYYAPGWTFARTSEELEAARAPAGTTWLVYTFSDRLRESKPQLWRIIETQFEPVREFPGTVGDGTVLVCRSSYRRLAQNWENR